MCCWQKMIALGHKQMDQLGSTFLAIGSRGDELILVFSSDQSELIQTSLSSVLTPLCEADSSAD